MGPKNATPRREVIVVFRFLGEERRHELIEPLEAKKVRPNFEA
jgi:hypothetical protein